jgi:membrane-associated phospholipid phosphatase
LVSGLIAQTLKFSLGRARPYLNKGAYYFNPITPNNDYNSFPSGHTIVAFTISTVLSRRFNNTYASIGLYTLASLTAYQRIYSNNHWFSDTFLSAAIGIVVGNSIVEIQDDKIGETAHQTFSVVPIVNNNYTGVGFFLNF